MDRFIFHASGTVIFMNEFLKQTGKSIEEDSKARDEMLRERIKDYKFL